MSGGGPKDDEAGKAAGDAAEFVDLEGIASDALAPPAAPARRAPAKHVDEPPAIVVEGDRPPTDLPGWAAPAAAAPPPRPSRWPRRAMLIAAGVLVAVAGRTAIARLRPHPPVIASVVPSKAEPGQTVTIGGTALGHDVGAVVVRFGDRRGAVTSATGSALAVTVPADLANAPAGDVRVVVEVDGAPSNALFMTLARFPRVAAVEPPVALPGDEVVLRGANLDPETVSVRVGGFPAIVVGAERDGVRVKLPEVPFVAGQAVPVEVSAGRDAAAPASLIFGHLPLVTSIVPESAEPGATVTLAGFGLAAPASVAFGGLEALVLAASERELRVVLPVAGLLATRNALPVVVVASGARSAPHPFTVARPSEDTFLPRFAPAPAPAGDRGRHALVATELGPVLVLTGRADAPTVVERASRVAAALTAALRASASRPVTIEAREGAVPAVVLAPATTIVTVTAEDAETFSRGYAGVAGARVSASQLARYWAAYLNDYVGLFGRGQRPNRVAEMTPRARVLLDLHADAARRGGAPGVAAGLVAGMPGARTEALRQLAFAAPAPDRPTGLSLAGSWEGTMEDDGAPRPMRLTFRADGGRLTGALASRSGSVVIGVPLRDLRYDKGVVRFTAVLGGIAREFHGLLDGASLSGTSGRDGRPSGRFTLRHVE